jgi:GDP-D-mannose 3', 5'-epimerase
MKKNFWKDKRVLITGAAGFIGSNLAADLLECGADLRLVDNMERGKLEFIDKLTTATQFKLLDLRNYDSCLQAVKGIDIVIHLASKVGGIGFYQSHPFRVMADNLQIDTNMIQAALQCGATRFFYASSAHVYPLELQMSPECPLIAEDQAPPADPELSYGWAKLVGEKTLQFAAQENPEMRIAMARYVGIYGKNQDFQLETGSVIPVFSHRAIRYPEIPFSIWGTGEETRSYCFIDDAIECTKLMIEKMEEQEIVGPLNVGKQELTKIKDIADKIVAISKKDVTLQFDKSKKTTIWGQLCDCSKAKQLLGWEAETSLEEGLKVVYKDVKSRI